MHVSLRLFLFSYFAHHIIQLLKLLYYFMYITVQGYEISYYGDYYGIHMSFIFWVKTSISGRAKKIKSELIFMKATLRMHQ